MDKQTSVLVAYASKHGSTRGIAQSIADTLRQPGLRVDVRPVDKIDNLEDYDAFVVGSAVYFGFWQKAATRFVRRNKALLASRPVWLFSSGPVGTKTTDPQGRDLRSVAEPGVINEFRPLIAPRDHRVFFGCLNPSKLTLPERAVMKMLASSDLFVEGDFRDQADIRAWATGIARALEATQAATR